MTEEELLFAVIDDKIAACNNKMIIENTNFLDIYKQSNASKYLKSLYISNFIFYGGFVEAERKMLIFLPDYVDDIEFLIKNKEFNPIVCLKIDKDNFSTLSHRDYLGAIMGLGIKREMIGDIIVNDKGCYIAVVKSIADYIKENLISVGRGSVSITVLDEFDDISKTEKFIEKRCYVSSMRIDGVISSVFNISRGQAVERIRRGEVFLNDIQIYQTDTKVPFSSKVVLRGSGKVIIEEDAGITKKGRQAFIAKKYI